MSEIFRHTRLGPDFKVVLKAIGTKALFNGGFAFVWQSKSRCPLSELSFVYEWGQQSSTQAQNGTQSHKFIDQVMHVPI